MEFKKTKFVQDFAAGKVFAYPTEAVYGLGCDPLNETAMEEILRLKHRPVEKGVILIAGGLSQLDGFVDFSQVPAEAKEAIFASWPGPHTWLIPVGPKTPDWICGGMELVAVRVTTHELVKSMCDTVDSPLVSTSANWGGHPPARSASEVLQYFGDDVILIDGALGDQQRPSSITNALTMQRIR